MSAHIVETTAPFVLKSATHLRPNNNAQKSHKSGGIKQTAYSLFIFNQGMRFRGSGVMSAGSEHTIDGLRFEGEVSYTH